MAKATAPCLHRVFLAPKPWRRQRLLAFTVCFWHQNHGEGNGSLPSPCVFGTKTMAKPSPCVFGTKTMAKATAPCLHRVFLAPKPWRRQRLLAFTVCFWHQNHGEGNGSLPSPCVSGTKTMAKATTACLHRVFLAPKPWRRQRLLAFTVCFWHQSHGEGNDPLPSPCVLGTKTMAKATTPCLHRVFLAPKPWRRQRLLAFTVCFWHQNHGEGNDRLPSPCVFGTKTMAKATAPCLHRVFLAPKPWRRQRQLFSQCFFGTKTMAKATAPCLHRVFLAPKPWRRQRLLAFTVWFWHQNHGEGNGSLPSPCVFGTKTTVKATTPCLHCVVLAPKPWRRQRLLAFTVCFWHQNHGEGNEPFPSPCVFGTKAMVKATTPCLRRVFLAPRPW